MCMMLTERHPLTKRSVADAHDLPQEARLMLMMPAF